MPSFLVSTIIAFFSTTIDDFAIMLYFFAIAENEKTPAAKRLQYVKVIAGQSIGFSIVILVSLVGFVLGLLIPEDYIDLIGFIPILAGFMKLHEVLDEEGYLENCPGWCRGSGGDNNKEGDGKSDSGAKYSGLPQTDDPIETGVVKTAELTGGAVSSYNNPAVVAPKAMYREGEEEGEDEKLEPPADTSEGNFLSKAFSMVCQSCLDPFTRDVTVMALICSSDNVAIYIAIFATEKKWEVFLTVILFYLLLALNIIAAIALMKVCPSLFSLFLFSCFSHAHITLPPLPFSSLLFPFLAVSPRSAVLPGLQQVLYSLLPYGPWSVHPFRLDRFWKEVKR